MEDLIALAQGRATDSTDQRPGGDAHAAKSTWRPGVTESDVFGKGSEPLEVQALFVKSVDTERRRITALASTATLDRHGEIIEPSAFAKRLDRYMANPVVLAAHQHRLDGGHSPVVGNVVKAWTDKAGFWVVVEFVAATELGEEYWQLYGVEKKQRALSVGFIPKEGGWEEREEKRVWIHREVELLEISCVAVPSNPDALSRGKGGKRDFVAGKRQEAEDERIMADMRREYAAQGRDFDAECEEFAEVIMGLRETSGALELQDDEGPDLASLATGGPAYHNEFVSLIEG